MMSDIYIR